MNKKECKRTAQAALRSEYGFKPPLSEITILEASDDRTYILFKVREVEYVFASYLSSDGPCVWVRYNCKM